MSSACSPASGCETSRLSRSIPKALRVRRIERVLDVDEGGRAAVLLRFGDHVERQRRLTARFRTVDFDDAAAREPADAQGQVEGDRAGRDDVERHPLLNLAHLHDRALAELPLDLREGVAEGDCFFVGHDSPFQLCRYVSPTVSRLSAISVAPFDSAQGRLQRRRVVKSPLRLARQSNLCSIDNIGKSLLI